MKRLWLNAPNIVDQKNQIHSIYPCTGYLTFGPWLYLVPQYKPKSVLMLGYGGGTAAGLIRMFYGDDVAITAVDIEDCSEFNYYDVKLIEADAERWIKTADSYDCIIVDLYTEGNYRSPDFCFTPEFVGELTKRCNYLIFHAVESDDMSMYPKPLRILTTNNGTAYNPLFYYFTINDIPSLPIR